MTVPKTIIHNGNKQAAVKRDSCKPSIASTTKKFGFSDIKTACLDDKSHFGWRAPILTLVLQMMQASVYTYVICYQAFNGKVSILAFNFFLFLIKIADALPLKPLQSSSSYANQS